MESLSFERQFQLLRKNIGNVQILIQVLSYSLNDLDAEMSFMFSEDDRIKLGQAALIGKQPMTITQLTKWAPLPTQLKQVYITRMLTLSNPFLKDKKIFVLMLMILLFEDKSDPNVNNVSGQYWTMLKRHLETKTEMIDKKIALYELEKLKMSLIWMK